MLRSLVRAAAVASVYPLAAFADTLVELALAAPNELSLRWEDVKKPGATRHAPGLKCEKAIAPVTLE